MKLGETGKQLLSQINNYMMGASSYDAEAMWNILTALRGPDNDNPGAKMATTALIRNRALSKEAVTRVGAFGRDADKPDAVEKRRAMEKDEGAEHFTMHMKGAFNALGLEWGEVNE